VIPLKPRRTIFEIVWNILDYCREPKILTHIMLYCNLNTPAAKKYLELLILRSMLSVEEDSYKTTSKGMEYLDLVQAAYLALFESE
jgi:predicted transcriptional regulator